MNKLDGVFHFMRHAYGANWQFRWSETPFLEAESGKGESIAGHMWACIGLWLNLRRVCPNLDKVVDSVEIYETLWSHDLGEIYRGDVSLIKQLRGEGADKSALEREEIAKMTAGIDPSLRKEILAWFEEMEKPAEKMTCLESLVAVFIDSLQGNHFALSFGHHQKDYSKIIQKIIDDYQIPYFRRLVERLLELGHKEAASEVKKVIAYHFAEIKRAGISLHTAKLADISEV